MKIDFLGKKVLVLAGSQGLGKEIAKTFAANGADVVICSRNLSALKATADEIGVIPIKADLSIPEDVEQLMDKAKAKLGQIDILVTNTGGPPKSEFIDTDTSLWEHNFKSLFLSASIAARLASIDMLNQGWGRIIFLASIAAKEPVPGLVLSNALRAGLLALSKTLSNEVAPSGITVNCVLPGYIHTKRLEDLGLDLDALASSIPMKRLGNPSEFANTVAFLASDLASYITGQAFSVDGGMTRSTY